MKPIKLILLMSVLIAAGGKPCFATTFKIATLAPAGTAWMKEMKNSAKSIAERTEGRVRLKLYPGGVMGSEQSVHRKIRIGQLHGGAFSSGGMADIYPDIQCLNLPMLFNSFEEVDYVRSKMEPVMKQNMEKNGFVLLGIAEAGFTRILSKSPMKDLESIKASKLWAPEGDLMVKETYHSMGLSPISLPISDVFTGLQTGLIETVTITPSAAIAFQWHSSTAYITDVPLAYLIGVLAIQKRAFDKISETDKIIVKQEVSRAVKNLDQLTREDNLKASAALQHQGIVLVKPEMKEILRWRLAADNSIDRLIEKGALTRAGVDKVRNHLQNFRASN
ncbi:MAG: C4-dicarboxylate ABC transporter [Gammaproteobacteria bacterium]|nr:C4-dicarboxylate ABC transporter [Gammaproteobacteria bacterium]